jgi:5-methyltetrahydrofolate--homocysteine methyltransferase
MEILDQIAENLQQGDEEKVAALTRQAIEQEVAVDAILQQGLIAAMDVVGRRFREYEIFLPDVLLAARAMTAGMELLKPLLVREGVPTIGKVVVGTVHGDLHEIGKNLVGTLLAGAGFEVVDLGKDVPPEKFVTAAVEAKAPVIGMSALLTTTMPVMKEVVDLVRERGLSGEIKTIVGGAPVSREFAREIGADAHGYDAANAVERIKGLIGVS